MIHGFLPNGVEYFVKENHFARMAALQVWVGAGSIDEADNERGIAHLIEHMLFKGTERRKLGEISAAVEAHGGEINAYTTFDRTVYYLSLVSAHTREGLDILADAVYNSTFDADELAREKEVVLEEIRRGEDDPGSKLGKKAFQLAYAGTEAGRPIIGSTESVSGFTRDDVVRFHTRWYQPSNIRVVAIGDFDEKIVEQWIREFYGAKSPAAVPARSTRERDFPTSTTVALLRGDYKQPRLEICWPAPALEHGDTPGLDLAAFCLGSGEASRLSRELRDKRGVVTAVDASVYAPSFGGLLAVSALSPEESLLGAIEGIAEGVTRLVHVEPITAEEIARARVNMRAERVHQEETVEGQARAAGFGLTTTFRVLFDEAYRALIDKTDEPLVSSALRTWVADRGAVLVAMVPNESSITEDQMAKAFEAGVTAGRSARAVKKSKVVGSKARASKLPVTVKDIAKGIRVVYRQHAESKMLSVVAASEGGLRAETRKTAGLYNAFSGMTAVATDKMKYTEVLAATEGRGALLDGFSGKDSFGLRLQCLEEFGEALLPLFADCLIRPRFPEDRWKVLRREILEDIRAQEDSPANVAVRRFQEAIFGEHSYKFPIHGFADSVQSFTAKMLQKEFCRARDAGPWVIAAVGPWDPERFIAFLRKVCAGWKPASRRREFTKPDLRRKPDGVVLNVAKDREQNHIVFGYRGIDWFDRDRATVDVLSNVLGGNGGRLFMNLRDRESLAYAVSPIMAYGCHPGAFGAYIACAPDKASQALTGLKREMLAIANEGVSEPELDRAKQYIVGGHESEMQRSNAQATTMALMELYGIGYDDFTKYPQVIHKVKASDVQKLAKRLFRDEMSAIACVGKAAV